MSPLLMATTPQVPTTSAHSLINCRQKGDKLQGWGAGREFTALVPAHCLENCWEHPSSLPGSPPGDGCHPFTASILLPYDSAPWASFTGQPNKNLCLDGWVLCLTHRTPCTDGQAAHRVPVSLRSCLKSLSRTQPEWAKQTPLRSQNLCFDLCMFADKLYQLCLCCTSWFWNYLIEIDHLK